MEVLLVIACSLAWASGAQSEQTKLGLSKAQRDQIRENVRHEKAVRKIAEKHGIAPAETAPEAAPAPASVPAGVPATLPEAFRSGYRSHTPVARVATPLGRHAGTWAARGVVWVKDSGKSALREYRKRGRPPAMRTRRRSWCLCRPRTRRWWSRRCPRTLRLFPARRRRPGTARA
ncbi:hypothetical protein ACIOEY_29185 [Streptomyces albidoflavus]